MRAESVGAGQGTAAGAASAAGNPLGQLAAWSAVAATFAAAAAFAASDVAASEFAVAGVFAEELADRATCVASDQRPRSAAMRGDAAAIAAACEPRRGAAASQQA